jgi:hypothetical protein
MNESLKNQARSLRGHLQYETKIAVQRVKDGAIRDDQSFADKDGHQPFDGCIERLVERTAEIERDGDGWSGYELMLWCKQEADVWFDGYPDDTEQNRKDFTASIFDLAKARVRITKSASSQWVYDEDNQEPGPSPG